MAMKVWCPACQHVWTASGVERFCPACGARMPDDVVEHTAREGASLPTLTVVEGGRVEQRPDDAGTLAQRGAARRGGLPVDVSNLITYILTQERSPRAAEPVYEYAIVVSAGGQATASGAGVEGRVSVPMEGAAAVLINALAQLGFRVCGTHTTTGQAVWTMERVIGPGRELLTERQLRERGRS